MVTTSVQNGDRIKVNYVGTFDDGTIFDSSEGRDPLEFTVGKGEVIKGFDNAVLGMAPGEEKKVHILAAEAYGEKHPELVRQIPRTMVPQGQEPKPGMMIGVQTPDGRTFPGTITAVSANEITLDLNHPLAGKALNFTLTLVEITSGTD
jgi:FKBP-type peptidyl-prolyl cis-trans isomerase 2